MDTDRGIRWTITPEETGQGLCQNLPTVDSRGRVRTYRNTPLGSYRVTVTSTRIATVTGSVEIRVVSPSGKASLTQKPNRTRVVTPSAVHRLIAAGGVASRAALVDVERFGDDFEAVLPSLGANLPGMWSSWQVDTLRMNANRRGAAIGLHQLDF